MVSNFLHVKGRAPLNPVRLIYSQIHFSEKEQSFKTFIEDKVHKITSTPLPYRISDINQSDRAQSITDRLRRKYPISYRIRISSIRYNG